MSLDIPGYRLHNQLLSNPQPGEPGQIVQRLGAVQSQDYAGAKWALGLRLKATTDAEVDQAFNDGKILRTHVLRPTWHFVAPEDIRWMLALTGSRVHAANAFMYRQLELDRATIRKSYKVFEKALQRDRHLTRTELGSALERAGIAAAGPRLAYIVMSGELDGILCSGPRRAKQFTYSLLAERVSQQRKLERDEALAELTRRYFAARGPATLSDFTWWSGLTMADARHGIQMVKSHFVEEVVDGTVYWFDPSVRPVREKSPSVHLLPNYDEYFIGFKDRSAIARRIPALSLDTTREYLPVHIIILDGQIVGGWRRDIKKSAVTVELKLLTRLTKDDHEAIGHAADRYGKFLRVSTKVVGQSPGKDFSL
jgi:hypothetical protein